MGRASIRPLRQPQLLGKLLAFSRRQVLQPTRVDVAALLESLADMLRRTLDQRIRITVDVEPGCPPVLADPGQLESALLNIAINARDAMPDGGGLAFGAPRCPPSCRAAGRRTICRSPSPTRVRAFRTPSRSAPSSPSSRPRRPAAARAWG